MSTLYPTAQDTTTSLVTTRAIDDTIPPSDHNDLGLAIIEVEQKLGFGVSLPALQKILVGAADGSTAWLDLINALPTPIPGYVLGLDISGNLAWVSPSAGAGETNTASNINTAGVGVYDSKSGVNLRYKGLDSPAATISITNNPTNHTIEIEVIASALTLSAIGGTLPISKGGTGQTANTAAYNALSPNTTLGDIEYHDGTNTVRLAGSISAGKRFLTQTGNGSTSAAPSWGSLVAGDIPTLTSAKISDFVTAVIANTLDTFAAPTSNVQLNAQKIVGLADPTSAQDAATKTYVDAQSQGLDVKASVRTATFVNIASLASASTSQGGVTLVQNDRILLMGQTTASQNGIYTVGLVTTGTAPLTRATDADNNAKVTSGMYTFVSEGTYAAHGYVLTTADPITLNTTSLAFTQFSAAGAYIGTSGRVSVSGNQIDIDTAYVGQATINTVGTITTGTWQGTAIGGLYGGTGFSSYTKGDLLAGTASGLAKRAVGSDGQVLTATSANSDGLSWTTPPHPTFDAVIAATGGDYTTCSAALAAGMRTLFVRRGTYTETTLNTAWTLTGKAIVIIGEDRDNTILQLAASTTGFLNLNKDGSQLSNITVKAGASALAATTNGWVDISGSNCYFDNVKFVGQNNYTYNTGCVIHLNNSNNHTFLNCFFNTSSGDKGMILFDGCSETNFTNCIWNESKGYMTQTVQGQFNQRITFTGCFFNTDAAIFQSGLASPSVNAYNIGWGFVNCRFYSTSATNAAAAMINMTVPTGFAANFRIEACWFRSEGYHTQLLNLANVTSSTFIGNTFLAYNGTGAANGIVYLPGCDYSTISGNSIQGSGNATNTLGLNVQPNSGYTTITGNNISGITGATSYALQIGNAGNNTITGNTLQGNTVGIRDGSGTSTNIYGVNLFAGNTQNYSFSSPAAGSQFDAPYAGITSSAGASATLNLKDNRGFKITLTASSTFTFTDEPTMTAKPSGLKYVFHIIQNATGGWTVTWPANVVWAGGAAPTITATASKRDIIELVYDSGLAKYIGYVVAQNI